MTLETTIVTTYHVEGMTCGHCASAVTQEVGAIPDVGDVTVELLTGEVTVCSSRDLTRDEVAAAVEEAGYRLADEFTAAITEAGSRLG